MITVRVKRRPDGEVQAVTIDGHAGFADPGEDLVCAAVSGISFGMMNAIEMLLHTPLPVQQGDSGFLHCDVPDDYPEQSRAKMQLLVEGMIASLQAVSLDYGKFIKVLDQNKK